MLHLQHHSLCCAVHGLPKNSSPQILAASHGDSVSCCAGAAVADVHTALLCAVRHAANRWPSHATLWQMLPCGRCLPVPS